MHANSLTKEDFARLFAEHHRRIFGYVRSLVPSAADADEVFQETCVVLWREFENYDRSRPFAPWAIAIARNQVRTLRHRHRRERLVFSDTLIDELSVAEDDMADQLASRTEALATCIHRLNTTDRELVAVYYGQLITAKKKFTMREAAEQLGRPVDTVYKALRRIRESLMQCVERQLIAEERGGDRP